MKRNNFIWIGLVILACAAANLVINIVNIKFLTTFSMITLLISTLLLFFLGFAAFRGKNDIITLIAVVLYGLFALSIPMAILVVLLLIRRFTKYKTISKTLWFTPAIAAAILSLITFLRYGKAMVELLSPLYYVQYFLPIPLFLCLGFWLLKELKDNDSEKHDKSVAYLDDLMARGVISKEEYDQKINDLNEKKEVK